MTTIYIIHGFQASPQSHWFPWLHQQLESLGISSNIVHLQDSSHPDYSIWKQDLSLQLKDLQSDSVVIAHSLGCVTALDYLSSVLVDRKIKAFIGVSGFQEKLKSLPELNQFVEQTHVNESVLRLQIQQRYVIFSNNDLYVPAPLTICLGQRINAQMIEIKGAGHFLTEDGYSEFPRLLELLKNIVAVE